MVRIGFPVSGLEGGTESHRPKIVKNSDSSNRQGTPLPGGKVPWGAAAMRNPARIPMDWPGSDGLGMGQHCC